MIRGYSRGFFFATRHSPLLIIGGGSAGLNVTAQMIRDGHVLPH